MHGLGVAVGVEGTRGRRLERTGGKTLVGEAESRAGAHGRDAGTVVRRAALSVTANPGSFSGGNDVAWRVFEETLWLGWGAWLVGSRTDTGDGAASGVVGAPSSHSRERPSAQRLASGRECRSASPPPPAARAAPSPAETAALRWEQCWRGRQR